MLTSKQRAELRSEANTLETTLMVGKGGITENVIAEAATQLEARELDKGRVLEAALLTAREACDALCEALHAEGVQCVGSKFVLYKKSEKKIMETVLMYFLFAVGIVLIVKGGDWFVDGAVWIA